MAKKSYFKRQETKLTLEEALELADTTPNARTFINTLHMRYPGDYFAWQLVNTIELLLKANVFPLEYKIIVITVHRAWQTDPDIDRTNIPSLLNLLFLLDSLAIETYEAIILLHLH